MLDKLSMILLNNCDKQMVIYLAAIVLIAWTAIKIYQYFAAENIRAKRQKKIIQLMIELCSPSQAAWLVDDSRNSEPPK